MQKTDQQAFAKIMAGLGETYKREISNALLDIYFETLKHMSVEDFREAATKHLLDPQRGSFWPVPADFNRYLENKKPSVEAKAEIAWSQIMGEVSRIGPYRPLELADKQALAAVKALGGWKYLCTQEFKNLTWIKKEFIQIYETYEKTPAEALPARLPGVGGLIEHKRGEQKRLC